MKIDVLGIPDALTRARERRAEHAPPAGPDAPDPNDQHIGPDELAELVAGPDPETTMEDRDQMGMSL